MADTKISALPASTTPLAGTEILPIVQSSTTKQVSVANLTAGRVVAASGLNVSKSGNTFATVGTTSSGSGAGFQILDNAASPTKNNLLIAVNYNLSNTLEFTPSTTAGGSTFSTPAVTLDLSSNHLRAKFGVSGGAFTTSNRNALSVASDDIGLMVFDTTLGKPVWLKNNTGPVWVDAAGTTV